MDTLVYLLPAGEKNPPNTSVNFNIGNNGILKIIYCNKDIRFLKLWRFKSKMKSILKNCTVFANEISDNIKCKKIYLDGTSLIAAHLNDIILSVSSSEREIPIVIFSDRVSDLKLLKKTLTTLRKIQILTTPEHRCEFENVLLNEYGIAGALRSAVQAEGKIAVVMPNVENFSFKGFTHIINMSKTDIAFNAVSPKSIFFRLPDIFKHADPFLQSADALETALHFFSIDFNTVQLSHVKLNK